MTGTASTSVCRSTGCTSPSFAVRVSLCWPWSQEQSQCPRNSTTALGKLLSITCSRWAQTVSRAQKICTSISPGELLDHVDFTHSTIFAIRKNYQLQKIPREVTEQAFLAIRVIFGNHAVVGFLLIARLWSLMTATDSSHGSSSHGWGEGCKDRNPETLLASRASSHWTAGTIQKGSNLAFSSFLHLTLTLEHLNFKPQNIFVNEPLRQVEKWNGEQKPQVSSVLLPFGPQKFRL